MNHDGPPREALGRRSARGGTLLFAANAVQLGVAVVATMILARLLTPADFGRFAMATAVIALAGPVREFGLPLAIAHAPTIDSADLDALFRRNLGYALALGALLCAAAPLAAFWFDEPAVSAMVIALALGTTLRALANVHVGLLVRRMHHRALALVGTGAEIAGAVVGVTLAVLGAGVTALLVQQLVVLSAQALIAALATEWRPRRAVPGGARGERVSTNAALLGYARRHTASRLLGDGAAMADRLILGRVAGATALGLYQSALRWVTLPLMQLLQPFKNVTVTAFARLREDPADYRRYASHAFAAVQSLVMPLFVLLALEAPRLVTVLLGAQWSAAVPLFRLLAIAMLFESVDRMAGWIYLGEGRTATRLRWSLAVAPLTVLAVLLGARWGTLGVAWAFALTRAALAAPSMLVCLRASPLRHRDIWRGAWRPALATFAAAGAVLAHGALGAGAAWPATWQAAWQVAWAPALGLAASTLLFASVYVGVWVALPDGRRTAALWIGSLRAVVPAKGT